MDDNNYRWVVVQSQAAKFLFTEKVCAKHRDGERNDQ
jgi:hypothetical protein